MNCPNCKRQLATEEDHSTIPETESAEHLCWTEWNDDESCERIAQAIKESALTTIEILQAAIAEGCEVRIYTSLWNDSVVIHVYIEGQKTCGWATGPIIEESIATAWKKYQTNKKQ